MVEAIKNYVKEKPVQSVERTFRILELLAERGHPMNLGEISKHLELKVSTAHRLLKTLIMMGFAQQDLYTGKYQLGIKTFSIGNTALYTLDVRTIARPYLKKLALRYKETANLAILDQGDAIYIDQVESDKMVKMIARLGSRAPTHSNAVGKALLAFLNPSELDRFLASKELESFTRQTITSPNALKNELEKVKKQGYALDVEETEDGIRCVASPILNHLGKAAAAVGVSGLSSRISLGFLEGELAEAVMDTALQISVLLGHQEM